MTASLFARESPRPAALMRIGLGLVLLWDAVPRWPFVVELYSTGGMTIPLFPGTAFEPPALSARFAVVLYALLLFSLVTVTVGWQTRLSLLIAFVLSAWLGLLDFAGTFKKYSAISLHLLVLLAFTQSHAVWSVDAWLERNRRRFVKLSPTWPRFLLRGMVSSIYLGAAVTKLRLPDFAAGDLLMFSLLDHRWGGTWIGVWLATQPRLLVLVSFATILFEMTAAFLLWIPRTRRPVLLLAFLFHLAIGLSMHVGIFSPMMFVALLAFVRETDFPKAESGKRKAEMPRDGLEVSAVFMTNSRGRIASFAAFVVLGTVSAASGFALYGVAGGPDPFGDDGDAEWKTIEQKTFDEILIAEPPRPGDYFHRMEIGSRAGYRQLFGERVEFRSGATVYVLARLALQPRQPLQLQWVLVDSAGKEWQRHSTSPNPLFTYVTFAFDTSNPRLPPGLYEIVLEADGEVVGRKPFHVVGDDSLGCGNK